MSMPRHFPIGAFSAPGPRTLAIGLAWLLGLIEFAALCRSRWLAALRRSLPPR